MTTNLMKSLLITFLLTSLLILSSCDFTVHRELKHQYFSIQYPNWEDYKLEKYEDRTFKAITTDDKKECNVLVSSYTASYLTVSKIISESIKLTPTFVLLEKETGSKVANIEYQVVDERNEHIRLQVTQCGDYAYVAQYTCKEHLYESKEKAIATVLGSVKCTAPVPQRY